MVMSYIDMDNVANSNESDIQSFNVDEVKLMTIAMTLIIVVKYITKINI